MFRTPMLSVLCLAVLPAAALAQDQTASAGLQQAASAFGQCVEAGANAVPASVTPEAGAASVLAGCAAQRQSLAQAIDAFIATAPEEQRPAIAERARAQLDGVEAQVVAGIRQQRAASAPSPAAEPAPAE